MATAEECVALLAKSRRRLVLAESCTCGQVAAKLGEVPGVSNVFCGSMVTYRDATKSAWLGVSSGLIQQQTSVSSAVAAAMATGALTKTPEADLAISVTGHLGPGSPALLDGVVYLGVAWRGAESTTGAASGDQGDADVAMRHRVREYRTEQTMRNLRRAEVVAEVLKELAIACEDELL